MLNFIALGYLDKTSAMRLDILLLIIVNAVAIFWGLLMRLPVHWLALLPLVSIAIYYLSMASARVRRGLAPTMPLLSAMPARGGLLGRLLGGLTGGGGLGVSSSADWFSTISNLFANAHAAALLIDRTTRTVTLVPLSCLGGRYFGARVATSEGIRIVLVYLDESDIVGYLMRSGIPFYIIDGRWVTPTHYVGMSVEYNPDRGVLAKIIEGRYTYAAIKLREFAPAAPERLGTGVRADPVVIAETLIEIGERLIDNMQNLKVIEFAPGFYIGLSMSEDKALEPFLSELTHRGLGSLKNVNELFKRSSTIEETTRELAETERVRLQVGLRRLEILVFALIMFVFIIVSAFAGGATGILEAIGSMFGLPPIHGAHAHKPPAHATPPKHTPQPATAPAHVGKPPPMPHAKTTSAPQNKTVTPRVYTPVNKTRVVRPPPPSK